MATMGTGGLSRILLADEHPIFRCALRHLLKNMVPIAELVGEAGDGEQLLRLVGELNPDLVIMDLVLPGLNGIDVLRRMMEEIPTRRVIVLTERRDAHYVAEALRCGAKGYLLKDSSVAELLAAISSVISGKTYLSPPVAELVVQNHVRRSEAGSGEKVSSSPELSVRQREVLRLLAEGNTSKEIAANLMIGIKTVETHRNQIMTKLHIRSIAGLTKYAIRSGFVLL